MTGEVKLLSVASSETIGVTRDNKITSNNDTRAFRGRKNKCAETSTSANNRDTCGITIGACADGAVSGNTGSETNTTRKADEHVVTVQNKGDNERECQISNRGNVVENIMASLRQRELAAFKKIQKYREKLERIAAR